jgi:alkylation response protein AidB-like acyl-CoA dehydrogenase
LEGQGHGGEEVTVEKEERSTEEEERFRAKVTAWLEENVGNLPISTSTPLALNSPERVRWVKGYQAALYDAGLAGLAWPKEYGGQGFPMVFERLFQSIAANFPVPLRGVLGVGIGMCGPTILAEGSEDQKQRYIRPLLRGDEIWCQLFSEPSAGSDLASLSSSAVWNGSGWTLNGQKVWSSMAHFADYGLVVARTDSDAPKHNGLSVFLLDMHTQGVIVRPLKQMSGPSDFNEVFFEDVQIPLQNLVGQLNEGWRVVIVTLMNERVSTSGGRGGVVDRVTELIELARERGLNRDPVMRQRLANLYIGQSILKFVQMRIQETREVDRPPGPGGSIAKLTNARLANVAGSLAVELAGPGGVAWSADEPSRSRWAVALTEAPARRIAGGTDEVQKNILAERVLHLPR